MNWQESVARAIKRLSKKNGNDTFTRQQLIDMELDRISRDVGSAGETPEQTLSRVLQELRDQGMITFVSPGIYRLSS